MRHPSSVCAFAIALLTGLAIRSVAVSAENETLNLWPSKPPGETEELPPEVDKTKPTDKLIAGRRIIKLGNVATPQIEIFRPQKKSSKAAVVICPGGGHYILAMDLEGTEVAEWFSKIGVTAIVLKYRVPAREPERRWRAAVQDAQRAMSIVRSRAKELEIDPDKIGMLGFSAGGETAALAALMKERTYKSVDEIDKTSCLPDFAMLIYPGGLVGRGQTKLHDYIKVTKDAPPMFFVHAFDDRVTPLSSLLLAAEVKKAGGSAELHVYAKGGHGYGLRETEEPVTHWPQPAELWLKRMGFLSE